MLIGSKAKGKATAKEDFVSLLIPDNQARLG